MTNTKIKSNTKIKNNITIKMMTNTNYLKKTKVDLYLVQTGMETWHISNECVLLICLFLVMGYWGSGVGERDRERKLRMANWKLYGPALWTHVPSMGSCRVLSMGLVQASCEHNGLLLTFSLCIYPVTILLPGPMLLPVLWIWTQLLVFV